MKDSIYLTEIKRNFTNEFFHSREHNNLHNPHDQEVREFTCVRNGDVEQLKITLEEHHMGKSGVIAPNPLRNAKNLSIITIALTCRAAVEGGLHYEVAYSLSDCFINKIEELSLIHEIYSLAREAQIYYTILVRDLKKGAIQDGVPISDSRIRKCKNYIYEHIHGKILLQDIANALYINPNYLSRIFKKSEGMTIGDFILQEKIKLVKNMLIYSTLSFSEIASTLSFSSQSHLGRQFKSETGMTLRTYRETYSIDSSTSKEAPYETLS